MEKQQPRPSSPARWTPCSLLDPALGIFHLHQVLWSFGHSEAWGSHVRTSPGTPEFTVLPGPLLNPCEQSFQSPAPCRPSQPWPISRVEAPPTPHSFWFLLNCLPNLPIPYPRYQVSQKEIQVGSVSSKASWPVMCSQAFRRPLAEPAVCQEAGACQRRGQGAPRVGGPGQPGLMTTHWPTPNPSSHSLKAKTL